MQRKFISEKFDDMGGFLRWGEGFGYYYDFYAGYLLRLFHMPKACPYFLGIFGGGKTPDLYGHAFGYST